jgi:hypothetical protein
MFTLTRLGAAILLMLFALWLAAPYDRLYDPGRPLPAARPLLGTVGFCVGWAFLGGRSRALWLSLYMGLQAVALTGIVAALLAAVRDIFVLGYRRRFDDAAEAVIAIPGIALDYLARAMTAEFVTTLVMGGLVLGLLVHVIDRALDRRRLNR